jgi:hypothetical protein
MAERNASIPAEKRINFRIGINLGDVIVEEHDTFGDGVNVAARLEGLAEPGGCSCPIRSGTFDLSTYRDRYQEALRELIEAKTKELTIKPQPVAQPSPVIDLAALKRSLARGAPASCVLRAASCCPQKNEHRFHSLSVWRTATGSGFQPRRSPNCDGGGLFQVREDEPTPRVGAGGIGRRNGRGAAEARRCRDGSSVDRHSPSAQRIVVAVPEFLRSTGHRRPRNRLP